MSAEVLTRDLRDRRVPALGLGTALAALSINVLAIASGMRQTLDEVAAGFPDALTAFTGGDAPGGYVVGELFNLIGPLVLLAYAILTGAGAIAGEESSGTMALLSAQPVARTRILVAKAGGLLAAVVVATGMFAAGAVVGELLFDAGLDVGNAVAASVHLVLLVGFFGVLALAVGAVTGRPEVAAGVAGALAAVSYVSYAVLPLAGLDGWAEISPWFYYSGSEPLAHGLDVVHLLVLAAASVAVLVVALRAFDRRDLKG